jgi:hypothetical protein
MNPLTIPGDEHEHHADDSADTGPNYDERDLKNGKSRAQNFHICGNLRRNNSN